MDWLVPGGFRGSLRARRRRVPSGQSGGSAVANTVGKLRPQNGAASAATRADELRVFLFLTVILAPALAVMLVGGLGFTIWMYQLIAGPPGPHGL